MGIESAILNALKAGADDGRKTASGTKKGVKQNERRTLELQK
jgi:hypothetical protein